MALRSFFHGLTYRQPVRSTIGGYVCSAIALSLAVAWLGVKLFTIMALNLPTAAVVDRSIGSVTLSQDAWHEQIRTQAFWRDRGSSSASQGRSGIGLLGLPPGDKLIPLNEPLNTDTSRGDLYRTVCVRLCDGSFTPMSFSTTRQHFAKDQARCENSCGSPTRLFIYNARTGTPEQMVDVDGVPYAELPTANLFRSKYDAACKCRAHPWEEAALARHKIYALEAGTKKTKDATVTAQVAEQRQKIDAAGRALKVEQATLTGTKLKASATAAKPRMSQAHEPVAPRDRASGRTSRTTLDSANSSVGPAKLSSVTATKTAVRANQPAPKATWRETAFRGN